MEESRQTTVLFADVSGSTKLYETAGDAVALTAIGRCIERMRKAAESTGGRVVKTIGDEIMALFPSPDAAAGAASEMHATIEQLPEVGGAKLGVRVGFHSGPVVADQKASRQHCTIERRQDKWVLKDRSTNGTYVTAEGDSEMLLQREELTLRKHGWIAFGQPRSGTTEVVEYFCD